MQPLLLYHGTRHRLEAGFVLDGEAAPEEAGLGTGDGYVYASERREAALEFARLADGPHEPCLYLVEPLLEHPLARDPNELNAAGSWCARQLLVIERA